MKKLFKKSIYLITFRMFLTLGNALSCDIVRARAQPYLSDNKNIA